LPGSREFQQPFLHAGCHVSCENYGWFEGFWIWPQITQITQIKEQKNYIAVTLGGELPVNTQAILEEPSSGSKLRISVGTITKMLLKSA